VCGLGQATTIAPVPIGSLYENADIVAAVVITNGKLVEAHEGLCGALYEGKTIKGFKGAADNDVILFGHYIKYEVGGTYLVFLTKPGSTFRALGSTNQGLESERQKLLRRCEGVRTGNEIMHSGYGIMRMYEKNLIESYSVIKVSSKFVPMPKKLEVKRAAATELERFSEYVWVSFEKLSDYLESLGGMAHNKSPKPTQ